MRHLDPCTQCDGTMKVYRTITRDGIRRRYLKCTKCGLPDLEAFAVDELGRPIIYSGITSLGNSLLDPLLSAHIIDRKDVQ